MVNNFLSETLPIDTLDQVWHGSVPMPKSIAHRAAIHPELDANEPMGAPRAADGAAGVAGGEHARVEPSPISITKVEVVDA